MSLLYAPLTPGQANRPMAAVSYLSRTAAFKVHTLTWDPQSSWE